MDKENINISLTKVQHLFEWNKTQVYLDSIAGKAKI